MGDRAALHPATAINRSLTEAAWSVLEEARAPLSAGALADANVVHDVRKALKRWRALLRLMGPLVGEEEAYRLRIKARDLARGLAGARDPRSALDALGDLGEGLPKVSTKTLETIRKKIDRLRAEAELTILTDQMRAHLNDAFADTTDAIGSWSLGEATFRDVVDGLTKTYDRARRAIPDDWETAKAEDLHDLRKRVVEHRYQMELIEPLWPKLGRVWVGEAQRLRDRLGRHHDLTVLALLMRPKKTLASYQSRLGPIVRERQRDHARTAARLAGRLFAEKPGAFRSRLLRLWESRAAAFAETN
jgi:CHAD domain-containing protein